MSLRKTAKTAVRNVLDRFGLALIKHHYYSPAVFPADIRKPLNEPRKLPGIDFNIAGQLGLVRQFKYRDELVSIPRVKSDRTRFGYHNGAFEAGDAEMLYNFIRHFRPKKVVEIGCGQSTLMALLAQRRNADEGFPCHHTCVEPFEQPWLEKVGVHTIRARVEDISASLFERLEADDILFIDSSHTLRPQGDIVHEYLYLLPLLAPGVIVHVHDVFTPRDYPARWVVEERYLWNEQYVLEAFLSFNHQFEILAMVNYLSHDHREKLSDACPVLLTEPDHEPGSFWMRRKA
jgi:hypothetical protein